MEGAESSGSEVGNEDVMEIQVVSVDYSFFGGGGWVGSSLLRACRLSLVAESGGYSSFRCTGFSLWWLLVAEHGL